MEVDTTQFQASHGKPPYGIGQWRFQVGEETLSIFGRYSLSKQQAVKIALDLGEERIAVLADKRLSLEPEEKMAPQGGNSERPVMSQEQIDNIKNCLMAQAGKRTFGKGTKGERVRTVIPTNGLKAAEIMAIFQVDSKRTAHCIAKRGFYIVDVRREVA